MGAWDPPPVVFFECPDQRLRILFAYLAYHPPTDCYPIDAHLRRLSPNDHVFLLPTWHHLGFDPQGLQQYRDGSFPCQITVCANTPEEYQELQQAEVHSVFFNHGALLDGRIFRITNNDEAARPFRLVVNSTFAPYKRLHLAALVEATALIGYVPGSEYHPLASQLPNCTLLNAILEDDGEQPGSSAAGTRSCASGAGSTGGSGEAGANSTADPCADVAGGGTRQVSDQLATQLAYLSPQQVASALNRSQMGGLFSQEEGACWASTEYLLCGLPVVSTPCRGGREVWYDQHNSVVVESTPEAVQGGVERALDMLRSGALSRHGIRQGALQRAWAFRATLAAEAAPHSGAALFSLGSPAAPAYPRGTRVLHGGNRDYLLVPIGQILDESYTAYFRFTP